MILSPGLALSVVVGFLLLAGSGYLSSVLLFQVAHEVTAGLRENFVRSLLFAPVGYHRDSSTGQLLERLSASLADIDWFIKRAFGSLLGVLILMSGGAAMLFVLNWKLALFSTLAAPAIAAGLRAIDQKVRHLQKQRMDATEAVAGNLHGLLTGIEIVKAFQAESQELQKFAARQEALLTVQRRESLVGSLMEPLLVAMASLTFLVVLFFGGHLIARGELAAAELITFLIYLVFVIPNARNLALQIAQWRHLNLALDRLEEAAAIVPEQDLPRAKSLSSRVRGEVEFCRVHYGYAGRETVLCDLSFRIQAGERVGIVGESGAGKSTIFNLLLRFYSPDAGEIRIDGQSLQETTLKSLRGAIALVPQENVLFDDTILENIRFGNPAASEEQIHAACESARVADFIADLPSGMLTRVGERGLKLSGGQRQRLAIARAFLKDAPILLLDEATSSLDAITENELRLAMGALMQNRTTLVIAHRLSTVTHLPRILMVQGGRILDDGSHEELLNRCPTYRNFVSTQLIQQ